MKINKVAVIGAGTMGSGITGQIANAGIEVWLLDLPGDGNPNALAERGLERLRDPDQSRPAFSRGDRRDRESVLTSGI